MLRANLVKVGNLCKCTIAVLMCLGFFSPQYSAVHVQGDGGVHLVGSYKDRAAREFTGMLVWHCNGRLMELEPGKMGSK